VAGQLRHPADVLAGDVKGDGVGDLEIGLKGVPALATRARSVNPVSASIRGQCGERASPAFSLEGLEAGGMYSIWLINSGAQPTAFLTRDTTAVWRP
jgi:hypothetical protein